METKFIFVLLGDDSIKGFGKAPENTFEGACIAQERECGYRVQTFSRVEPPAFRHVTLPLEMRQ